MLTHYLPFGSQVELTYIPIHSRPDKRRNYFPI